MAGLGHPSAAMVVHVVLYATLLSGRHACWCKESDLRSRSAARLRCGL